MYQMELQQTEALQTAVHEYTTAYHHIGASRFLAGK